MTLADNHARQCATLVSEFEMARIRGERIGLRKSTSNLFRQRVTRGKRLVNVSGFDRVLKIDPQRMTADVEGMITYAALVDETLKFGLLPAVVPQLKTITVGGAVSGLGIESSSFKFGLVHETVEEMEILLCDGRLLTCSCRENPDLFFGFPNSYGTLGYALRLTIRLIPAKPYVHLKHTRFSDPETYFARVAGLCEKGTLGYPNMDYLDGTIFSRDEMYLTEGQFVPEAARVSDYTYMDIYYRSIQQKPEDWLTAKDYIWRWDTDWFWCSKHFHVQTPVVRRLAKWGLNSRTYQRIMRFSYKVLPDFGGTESVIQDVDIPITSAPEFFDFLFSEIGITPVWMCPFKTDDAGKTWDLSPLDPAKLYVNFGFWDMILSSHEKGYFNRKIEEKTMELGGAKGLYSSAWYDEPTFWSIYDQERYTELKHSYDPQGMFPDLYSKCVRRH
jgi:FAD/FMN-containing dehydrogenase